MAKNKNKGFSVIEIVIAIAILTLLLTPIVNQLAQTMSTNRRAKEQQYAVENAQYVMEYFKNSSLEVLGDTSDTTLDIYPTAAVTSVERYCDIYEVDASGNINLVTTDFPYNVSKYELNQVKLGSRGTKYNRYAVLDDLSIRLASTPITIGIDDYSFRVAYNMSAADGFILTDAGSLVQYEDDDSDPNNPVKYVSAIVCKRYGLFDDTGVANPNEINLGNMRNLDSTQLALITGNATDFDARAEKELYARAMDRLKDANEEYWQIEIGSTSSDHSYLNNYGYLNSLRKMTEIKIDDVYVDSTTGYYSVNVNVYYENSYLATGATNDRLEYSVYSQKFYYDAEQPHTCPDIYFEYQPFAVESEISDRVFYAANEYILIDNNAEDAKVYLYKPKWDMSHRYLNPTGDYDDSTLIVNSADTYYVSNFIDDADHSSNPEKVRISICNVNDSAASDFKNTWIYTNLLDENKKVDVNDAGSQFVTNDTSPYLSYFYAKGDSGSYTSRTVYEFDSDYLKGIDEEENREDRLFSVTVYLRPVDTIGNSIVLNGAKGAN